MAEASLICRVLFHLPGYEPVEDVRPRSECPLDASVGTQQSSRHHSWPLAWLHYKDGFILLCVSWTIIVIIILPNVTTGKGNRVNICCNLPTYTLLGYPGFWEHSLVDHFLLQCPTEVLFCRQSAITLVETHIILHSKPDISYLLFNNLWGSGHMNLHFNMLTFPTENTKMYWFLRKRIERRFHVLL